MARWPILLTLAATGCDVAAGSAVPVATDRPLRVMSMNQCTDQLVLALLPPARIASVSWLARDRDSSLLADAAMRVPTNRGLAEEVLAQKPDLVVTGTYTTPALRGMLQRLGYPMLEVGNADTPDDIRRVTRQVAAAVGQRARGEALIAAMDAKLAALARDPAPPIRVVAWDRTGFAAGAGSLYDTILRAAGARNIAATPSSLSTTRPDIETLLAANPALLVQGGGGSHAASLGDDLTRHRLVRRYWGDRTLTIPQGYYVCGTPMMADAAIRLRTQLRAATARATPALSFGGAR